MWTLDDGRHRGPGHAAPGSLPGARRDHRSAWSAAGTRSCSTRRTSRSRRTCGRPSRWSRRRAATAPTSRARSKASRASRTASAPTQESHAPEPRRRARLHPRDRGRRASRRRSATRTACTRATPTLDAQRVTDIVEAQPIPIALHGGSGLTDDQFPDLIARGCAKVNISTALKRRYMQSNLAFLREAEAADKWDPPSLFTRRAGRHRRHGARTTCSCSAARARR